MLTLDIETAEDKLVCVGWALDDLPVQTHKTVTSRLYRELADPNQVLVTHTGYDTRFLRTMGVDINCQMHDTQVMAWLVNENVELSLPALAARYLQLQLDKTLQKQAGTAPWDDVAAYCAKDVEVTRELHERLRVLLELDGLWTYFEQTEAPFTEVLRDMEHRGLPLNVPAVEKLANTYRQLTTQVEDRLKAGLPSCFNVRSHQQVAKFLGSEKWTLNDRQPHGAMSFETDLALVASESVTETVLDPANADPGTFIIQKEGRLWDYGVWVVAGLGTGFDRPLKSVSRDELSLRAKHLPWVQDYLEFKKYDKLVGTYLDAWPKVTRDDPTGQPRLHGRFNQTGTVTGRLSSSEPNLQNVPSRGAVGESIRQLFTGDFIVGDFSQLEPRLMAHYSQDPAMLHVFKQGGDIYADIAVVAGVTRSDAKTLMLAMSYGAGAHTIDSKLTQAASRVGAHRLLAKLQSVYSRYFEWRQWIIEGAKKRGSVQTLDGRRRHIGQLATGWKDAGGADRQAANAIIQGSAADVVRRTMLHAVKMFPELRLLAQVHDELVFELDKQLFGDPQLLSRLNGWVTTIASRGLSVPIVFEAHYGHDWFEAKEGTYCSPP